MRTTKLEKIWIYTLLVIFMLFFTFPIYWAVTTSFKSPDRILTLPPEIFPYSPTTGNYTEVINNNKMGLYFLNSLFVAISTTFVSVLIAALAGYGFSRFRFRGKYFWLYLILAIRTVPGLVFTLPYFVIFDKIGLLDTLTGLIVVYITATLPLAVWLFVGFYDKIPSDIYDAARIDGCGQMQMFGRVALPLVVPGIVVTSILNFLAAYNEFGTALILIFSDNNKTLPLAIAGLIQLQKDTPFGTLSAAGTIAIIPAFLLSLFAQKYLVSGFTAGAVKG